MSSLVDLAQLLDDDPEQAYDEIAARLKVSPDDGRLLYMLGVLHARAERFPEALAIYERVTRLQPKKPQAWNALGQALHELSQPAQARAAFKRALDLDPRSALYLSNIGGTYMQDGDPSEALRWLHKALQVDPEHVGTRQTLAFAQLATGDWQQGWQNHDLLLGGSFRQEVKIGQEPRWIGEQVESLYVYGEQGLGDEITYASVIPDIARSTRVTLDCDRRLEGLFRRSFPWIEVHGTRREPKPWTTGRRFDAGIAIASLPRIFRHSPKDCPCVPYLTACQERRLQWRALFDSWAKPVIGICWSGGRHSTGQQARQVGVEAFRGLIERTPDAVFVSLQYTDARGEIEASGLPVQHLHRAVQSPDYDDTAAFVAELDYVVGPPTTVHHLAGALGKPSTILVPSKPLWNVACGDRLPWTAEQVYHRQRPGESWAACIARFDLASHLHRVRPAPAAGLQRPAALDCAALV